MVANVVELQADDNQLAELRRVFSSQKQAYRQNPMPSADERVAHLAAFRRVFVKYQDELAQAVSDDYNGNRSLDECKFSEIICTLEGVKYYSKNLRKWMRPEKRHVSPMQMPASAKVVYQPLGVVGIIVPWNYPIFLATGPLMCALAAGNRVMIKMSSFTPRTGEVVKKMLAEAFGEDHVAVINGRGTVSEEFTRLPFDQITFTGSTNVGRTVMAEAAKNLTPVVLELGGKSPVIVHESYPLAEAAQRIAFGKCWNAGQTCVAPDYLLLPKGKTEEFVREFTKIVSGMYPTKLNNPDFTGIINDKQYRRVQSYLDDARTQGAKVIEINPANESFANSFKIPVTMVTGVTPGMQIMQNEIFGPILPIMEVNSLDEALLFVNERPRPLALYYFDWDNGRADYVLSNTHSGGACVNDVMSHVGVDDLPFGGVGSAGMGKYHGKEGFLAMSNAKGVLEKPKFYALKYFLPPFNKGLHKFAKKHMFK